MDFPSLLQMWGKRFQNNLENGSQTLGNVAHQQIDEADMDAHPDKQGPHSDGQTEDQDKLYNGAAAAVAGSMRPTGINQVLKPLAQFARPLVQDLDPKSIADAITEAALSGEVPGADQTSVAAAQQGLSRQVDQQARNAAQLRAARLKALSSFSNK